MFAYMVPTHRLPENHLINEIYGLIFQCVVVRVFSQCSSGYNNKGEDHSCAN